jgi:hypothetical protein
MVRQNGIIKLKGTIEGLVVYYGKGTKKRNGKK